MKRLLFTTPLVLLFLLNACAGDPPTPGLSATQLAAAIQTLTATTWTITPTPTTNYYIPTMETWLNIDLLTVGSLEATIDAKYSVTDIRFLNLPALTFRVEVNCICMNNNTNCCSPERTFVVILDAMKRNTSTALAEVPWDVTQMLVVCTGKSHSQIGAISVSWQNVQSYLRGEISGSQLGLQVTLTSAPTIAP